MKNIHQLLIVALVALGFSACNSSSGDQSILSPNQNIKVQFSLTSTGEPQYTVNYKEVSIIENAALGLVTQHADFSTNLNLVKQRSATVKDEYTLTMGKKQNCLYKANQSTFYLKNEQGKQLNIVFQVSNDGLAFQYRFPENDEQVHTIVDEKTTFNFNIETKAWLQPLDEIHTGFCGTNPSYERHYLKEVPVGTACPTKAGWCYPALFKYQNVWALISEADIEPSHCATRLDTNSNNGIYKIAFPMEDEVTTGGKRLANSSLPWASPWRIIALGDNLATIAESTLGTDVAKPSVLTDTDWIKTGKSSWSWVVLKDDFTIAPVQKEFIDYASEMGWKYCLIDSFWDQKIGYDTIAQLAAYAKTKNVDLILWYNSAGAWNTTVMTPKDKMLTAELRQAEFEKLEQMGISGIKVDFFAGDGQSVMAYYHDILIDAAKYHLTVNCHGATLPRGLQRTYPNYLTNESIKGYEYTTFTQGDMDELCSHACMLPFTRNCFDPMDFTPMCFDELYNINRISTNAFELATSILFVSGVQHYATTPKGMATVPSYVKEFIKTVPSLWEDSKLIDGYPGEYVAMARKANKKWYLAGINGKESAKTFHLDFSFMDADKGTLTLIKDGTDKRSFATQSIAIVKGQKLSIETLGYGGFAAVLE